MIRETAGTGPRYNVAMQGPGNSELPVRLGSMRGSKHAAGWFPCTKGTRKEAEKWRKFIREESIL
jgi:hypothetical protein